MTEFLPDKFKKKTKENIKKVEIFQRILGEDKLKILANRFVKFDEEYEKKIHKIMKNNDDIDTEQDAGKLLPINEAILTFDNRQVITVETPKITTKLDEKTGEESYTNGPQETKAEDFYRWPFLKFKLGGITVLGNINILDDMFDSEINALITGNFQIQYHIIGKPYDPEFLFATFEAMYKDQFDVQEIPDDLSDFIEGEHWNRSYSIVLYQVVETW
jgi:hypothetical protein